jgi:hypothetical protein
VGAPAGSSSEPGWAARTCWTWGPGVVADGQRRPAGVVVFVVDEERHHVDIVCLTGRDGGDRLGGDLLQVVLEGHGQQFSFLAPSADLGGVGDPVAAGGALPGNGNRVASRPVVSLACEGRR